MSMSMRKKRNGKDTFFIVLVIVVGVVIAISLASLIPIPYQWKKFLLFVFIPLFAIVGVLVSGKFKRK